MSTITQDRPAGARASTAEPLIAVIVPFQDPRGEAENLATWTREQTLAGDRFEVIALTNNPDPGFVQELRRYLRPQDRLLNVETNVKLHQHAIGIAATTAPLLFLTEDHCLADPDCLATVERYFADEENDAVTMHWGNVARTNVARMEELLSKIDFSSCFEVEHWNRVRVRGFALRRKVYEDVGGLEVRYGEFSEAIFAAKLHDRQYHVGYVPESGVRHVDTFTFRQLRTNAHDYAWNECAFCAENDPAFGERYFATPRILLRATRFPKEVNRWFARAAWLLLLRRGHPLWALQLLRSLYAATVGSATARIRSRLALWAARLRFTFWRFNKTRRTRAFQDYWARSAQCGRIDYVASHPGTLAPQPHAEHLTAPDLSGRDIFGCHPLEEFRGTSFRWTSGAAMMLFDLAPGDYRVTIDTGSWRGKDCNFPLGLFLNDHLLPDDHVQRGDGKISFAVTRDLFEPAGPQRLTIMAVPRHPSLKDRRRLGAPICAIDIEPI